MTGGDRLGASLPSRAASASWKSPIETPRRYRMGSSASRLGVRRAQRGRIAEVKRQDRRGKADAIGPCLAGAAVVQLHPLNRDRADAGLDQALRAVPVSDNALAPVQQAQA